MALNPVAILNDLEPSPEEQIVTIFYNLLKEQATVKALFVAKIELVEATSRAAFEQYAAYSLAVIPLAPEIIYHPSKRNTAKVGMLLSAFLPLEQTEKKTLMRALALGNYFRCFAMSNPILREIGGDPITIATVEFLQLPILKAKTEGVRICSYRVIYETDFDPTTGAFR